MNSIKDQSSGDSSHHQPNNSDITTQTEELTILVHPEPGTSLANAIGEQLLSMNKQFFQPVSSNTSNNDSEIQSLNELDNHKYKTELCRNYLTYGSCSYSSRCQFAHGHQELRGRSRHPKYKTEICRNFLSGYCKYASRCQFLHNSEDTTVPQTSFGLSTSANDMVYPTAVATIGTYLLTNMLAQSAAFGLGGSIAHQSALATLAACTNFQPNSHSLRRTTIPFTCGLEMQHVPQSVNIYSHLNTFHGISIPQNQNNNDSQLSLTHCQSQACINVSSENIQIQKSNNKMKRIRKSSAHI